MNRTVLMMAISVVFAATVMAAPLRVGVSVLPLETVVEAIGGPSVEAHSLQREGDSCSVFEPRPSAVTWLATADVFFRTGVAYETVLMAKIEDRFSQMRVVDLREEATDSTEVAHDCAIPGHGHDHDHDHDHGHAHEHDHGAVEGEHFHGDEGETHLWLDPLELIRVAEKMAVVIVEERPELEAEVAVNLESFRRRARALDADIAEALSPYEGRAFMIYHPALSRFAERYGLQQIGILGTAGGPRALADRIEEARAKAIRTIFIQPQESRRQAEILADALDAKLVEINPMERDWEGNLRVITEVMVATFSEASH